MLKQLWMNFVFLLAALVVTACAHKVPTLNKNQISEINVNSSGFIWPVQFQVEGQIAGQDGCVVEFRSIQKQEKYNLQIDWGRDSLFAEVPSGDYEFHDMTCGRYNWDLSEREWLRFHVAQGKISVLVPTKIRISDKLMIYAESLPAHKNQKSVLGLWKKMSVENQQRLISAYNQKTISESMFVEGAGYYRYEYKVGKGFSTKRSDFEYSRYRKCYELEHQKNPLSLGMLKLQAGWNKNEFRISTLADANLYSADFINCVYQKIEIAKDKISQATFWF